MVSRRKFLITGSSLTLLPWFKQDPLIAKTLSNDSQFNPIEMSSSDSVSLAKGYEHNVIAKTGDKINQRGDRFGDCADFTAFLPTQDPRKANLWVNHEAITFAALYGKTLDPKAKTKAQVEAEMKMVGGSFVELNRAGRSWELDPNSKNAFRIDATTEIPLSGPAGGANAMGMVGNCSGGITPWNTIVTCEENYGDSWDPAEHTTGWTKYFKPSLDHYGWVVEVDPDAKKARKLTALGRFAHEGAYVHVSKDNRLVVYMGDDARFQCLYKFVSDKTISGDKARDKSLLDNGVLYVADLSKGSWEPVSLSNALIKKSGQFKNESDVLINCRTAAAMAGGTPLARPEGIALDSSGKIYVSLTNNSKAGDYFGSILVISEQDDNHAGVKFAYDVYFAGSLTQGLVCPDNIVRGPKGSLWVTSDISGSSMGAGVYETMPRNGIYQLSMSNDFVTANRFALAPYDAEFTGPSFSQDAKYMFVSVQHPGEYSFIKQPGYTSQWPIKGRAPASGVICISSENSTFA